MGGYACAFMMVALLRRMQVCECFCYCFNRVDLLAVIGCDGIKSRVRQLIVGENHPAAHPTYTHKYAYRGLIPMEKAKEALGEDNAVNAKLHMVFFFPSTLAALSLIPARDPTVMSSHSQWTMDP